MNYWLFKSEPDTFSIDDLAKSPNQTTSWEGVRNYRARNILRDEVKKGDEVFFHHSSANPVGIAGTCVIVREGYPDSSATNPNGRYFDPKHTKTNPRWYTVDLKLVRKFEKLVPLAVLKVTPGLEKMMVTQRGARLSIQPVSPMEWEIIIEMYKKISGA